MFQNWKMNAGPPAKDNKPIIGRRPKAKDPNIPPSSTSVPPMKENANLKRICANPLDRLCEILLDWDFGAAITASLNKPSNGRDSPPNALDHPEFVKLPLTFNNFHQYIMMWEPLMIEELRENVISNYKTKPLNEIKKGFLQFKSSDRLPLATHTLDVVVVPASGNPNDPDK